MYSISRWFAPDPADPNDLGCSTGMAAYSEDHASVLLAHFRESPPETVHDTIVCMRCSDEVILEKWTADWGPTGLLWRRADVPPVKPEKTVDELRAEIFPNDK